MTPEASACPCCLITSSQENLGASKSRNRGLEESAAEFVLFLDDDVIPGTSWQLDLAPVIAEATSCPHALMMPGACDGGGGRPRPAPAVLAEHHGE